jgi:beta-phosphoglucomutase
MIKAVLMDLDGVLVSACDWHYQSLNMALKEVADFEINYYEHIKTFNGLPTKKKLEILFNQRRVEKEDFDLIFKKKQQYTIDIIKDTAEIDYKKIELHEYLKSQNLKLCCVTNSISETAKLMLECTGQLQYMDLVISNEDVRYPKPRAEGYITAMVKLVMYPKETIIVEDSPVGQESAAAACGNIWAVTGCEDVNLENYKSYIKDLVC